MTGTHFTVETDADGIALVVWDMPEKAMNVFTMAVMDDLETIIDQIAGDTAIKGAVVTSGKATFSGGADLTMLTGLFATMAEEKAKNPQAAVRELFDAAGRMSQLWRKLETCGKPWVSAINGTCLGGAFELSLACHGRVAADDETAKLGLPEVKVGLFPGAGGTQRVPRLMNAQDALQMMTAGKTVDPQRAKAMGLVHQVVPSDALVETAKAMIRDGLSPVQPWDEKGFKLPGGAVWTPGGAQLWPAASALVRRETYGNYPGPKAILKCVFEGLQVPFDTALRIEQRYFTEILQTREAFAMIRSLFVSTQALNKGARRPDGIEPTRLEKIGVLGAGFMGAGIAYVTAKAGLPVTLVDRDMEAAEKGKTHSEDLVQKAVQRGRMKKEDGDKLLSLITPSAETGDLSDADLVIEAVFEDRDVKKDVIQSVEPGMKAGAVFASNTSTLPIGGLAENAERPDHFIGIHFFSPVDRMMLVEIILGEKSGDQALATALDFARAIGKTPIVVNDTRGFFVNRCVLRYMNEAYDMLIEGVPPPMIENAAKMAGMPVGPLALNDEVAIDLSMKILKAALADMGEDAVETRHLDLVTRMVETEGRVGRKNGKGFYDYPARPAKKHLWPGLKELHPQKPASDIDIEVLKSRFLATIALEAARTMEEGIVTDPREADVGSILGFGFAPYTGGVLSYIDGMGLSAFKTLCGQLASAYGDHFRATRLIVEMAEKGETFYGRFANDDTAESVA